MKKYKVIVKLKQNVLDTEGKTIIGTAERLNFTGIKSLRVGKVFEIETEDNIGLTQIEDLAKKILVNPVIEVFEIEQ